MLSTTSNLELSIICPIYNEAEVLDVFMDEISAVLRRLDMSSEIIFIDDGSTDDSLNKLLSLKKQYEIIKIIKLSRNFGKEGAMTAGLDNAKGQIIIPIDADLQDPPSLIINLIEEYKKGYDVVLAKRKGRNSDSLLKKYTAQLFYKAFNLISEKEIPYNVGDFRLMSRKVVDSINNLPENQRFMKGLFSWVGYKTKMIEYSRAKRRAGKPSFNGWKLWNFALDGVTSFSTVPLRVWIYLGLILAFIAFSYGTFIIMKTLIYGVELPGYASLATFTLFLGGIQMVGIGILGEYVGRMYLEAKRRPSYIIEQKIGPF